MKDFAHEHNIFVGLQNLRDDQDLVSSQISLSKLRQLVSTTLNLQPFLRAFEKNLITKIYQFQ
jgi:hypothetical protein